MAHVKDMDSLQLSRFLREKNLANESQATKLVVEDIDGKILLKMSADQITTHVGYSFGNASRLISWLSDNSNPIVVIQSDDTKADVQSGRETKADKAPPRKLAVRKTLLDSSSIQRTSMGTVQSQLPMDPVTDVVEVRARIFGSKPAHESSNTWGKRYLENYQPRAHATHNRNIERMRGFFTDVYNPMVRKAWTSNFKEDKASYSQTVQFIEEFCAPELEDLDVTIQGVNMRLDWKAVDIMKGWFLDHKKHTAKKRRERIASLEAEDLAFLETIQKASTDTLEGEHSLSQPNVQSGLNAKPSSPKLSLDTEQNESLCSAGSFPGAYTYSVEKVSQPTEDPSWHNKPWSSPELSKTEILEESPRSDDSHVSKMKFFEESNGMQKIVSEQGSQSSNDLPQPSPEHKRQRKNQLVVGNLENGAHITRCAKAIDLGGERGSLNNSATSQSQGRNQGENNGKHPSPQHDFQSKTPLPLGRAANEPTVNLGPKLQDALCTYDLQVMPGLRRQTYEPGQKIEKCQIEEPLVSSTSTDPSTDAHSPNQSMTSTETTDSTKLIQPKRSVTEFYESSVYEAPMARRSKLPKQNSRSLKSVMDPCHGDYNLLQTEHKERKELLSSKQKMSELCSAQKPRTDKNKENIKPSLITPSFSKGKPNGKMSKPIKALGIDDLDEDSKLTIAYKAMRLSNKKEVKPQLKSYMAAQNQRVLQLNENASWNNKTTIPFSGHKSMEIPALLNLLVKWALEFKVEIVNPPEPINGKIRLFAQHIQPR